MIFYYLLLSFVEEIWILEVVFIENNNSRLETLVYVSISQWDWKYNYTWHAFLWKSINTVKVLLHVHLELKPFNDRCFLGPGARLDKIQCYRRIIEYHMQIQIQDNFDQAFKF
jgi:hypothetical protein